MQRLPPGEIELRVRRDYWRMVRRAAWLRLLVFAASLLRRKRA